MRTNSQKREQRGSVEVYIHDIAINGILQMRWKRFPEGQQNYVKLLKSLCVSGVRNPGKT
jgi:hypothetical protein